MATKECVTKGVAILYGAWGRQVDTHIAVAYLAALRDRSDYQVTRAVDFLTRNSAGHQYPPSAAEVNERAGKYAQTAEADRQLLERKRGSYNAALTQAMANRPRLESSAANPTDTIHVEFQHVETNQEISARAEANRRKLRKQMESLIEEKA